MIGNNYKNREIVEALFKKHYAELCNYAYIIVQNDDDAEDIVQQLFVDFIVNRRLKKVETSLEGYIFQSVRYSSLKFLKKKIRHQHLRIEDFSNVFFHDENEKGQSKLHKELDYALNSLPPRCKEVLVMVHVQNLSYLEASQVLGVSINTIKTQLKRGISIIRKQVSYSPGTGLD